MNFENIFILLLFYVRILRGWIHFATFVNYKFISRCAILCYLIVIAIFSYVRESVSLLRALTRIATKAIYGRSHNAAIKWVVGRSAVSCAKLRVFWMKIAKRPIQTCISYLNNHRHSREFQKFLDIKFSYSLRQTFQESKIYLCD